jgi:SAM-dependent methyltransferase
MPDWFEEWFGEEYLALYPHRDDGEAKTVATLIGSRVHLPSGSATLDLACGAGRHARALDDRWWTVGLDLSPTLLLVARTEDRAVPLVRADMRVLPFRDAAFALVVNLFTSFGYFRDDAQHRRVVGEVARVTRPGGWFVLDYLNADQVREDIVARDERRVGSRCVLQEREISADGRFIRKTITLDDEERTFVERVRLFDLPELSTMLEACGFEITSVAGDYGGGTLTTRSPRAILFGRRR